MTSPPLGKTPERRAVLAVRTATSALLAILATAAVLGLAVAAGLGAAWAQVILLSAGAIGLFCASYSLIVDMRP